ncbi:hypothetical protein H920_18178 [Fukomys damarensis]|uniref:Uncharacterized protein n=1 Tax=Fukomys damarensis TaxID=885580 RepID=A0A091CQJ6_FUKDA|nr:hypothetical protein H920_18178 [Fukomys damarensis]
MPFWVGVTALLEQSKIGLNNIDNNKPEKAGPRGEGREGFDTVKSSHRLRDINILHYTSSLAQTLTGHMERFLRLRLTGFSRRQDTRDSRCALLVPLACGWSRKRGLREGKKKVTTGKTVIAGSRLAYCGGERRGEDSITGMSEAPRVMEQRHAVVFLLETPLLPVM